MDMKGKRVAFLGDSITEGSGVADRSLRYDNRLKAMWGLSETYSDGIGGSRLAHQQKPSASPRYDLCFCGRAYNIPLDVDAVVVFGGTNDYGHGDAPFGELADTTPATYCGAVRFIMSFLRERFGDKPIVFMAPARRNGDESLSYNRQNDPEAHVLIDYVDVIKTVAKDYGIYVLDLYRELGIDPNSAEVRAEYAPDGLHFNEAGHGVMAEKLAAVFAAL